MSRSAAFSLGAGLLAVTLAASCKDEPPVEPPPAPPAVEEPTAPAAPALPSAVVSSAQVSLKETPDVKGKWKTTLMRGEKLRLLEDGAVKEGFLHVALSDGSEGYISEKSLLVGEVEEVVALEEKPLYARPDDAAPRMGMVQVGTLLFITKPQDDWIEVQLPKGRTGWMQASDVSRDNEELDAARAVFRYEQLKDSKKEARQQEAQQILAEALQRHPGSRVLEAMGLTTAAAQPATAAPAPAPAPAPAGEAAPQPPAADPALAPATP